MDALPPDLLATARNPVRANPMAWLYEITADITTLARPTIVFCTQSKSALTFAGITYPPFPAAQGPLRIDGEGNVPKLDLTISNVTRELVPYMVSSDGFLDRPVRVALVDPSKLSNPANVRWHKFRVSGCEVRNDVVVLTLEDRRFADFELPMGFYSHDRCPWIFRGAQCRYRGPETSCTKLLSACITYGDAEIARGHARMHPRQFGAMPGLSTRVS